MRKQFFLDTSSLVKLYHEETGTEALNSLINKEDPAIVISDITVIEMISAFAKKVRTGEIDEPLFNEVVVAFESDLPLFVVIKMESGIMARALDLLKTIGLKNGLKTLDSLQLASALSFSESRHLDRFITADIILQKIAENEGLNTG